MKKLLVSLCVIFSLNAHSTEMYAQNDAGGFITLTDDKCEIDKVKDKFPYYAYASTIKGEILEGCWMRPSMQGAPQNAVPIINIWHDGEIMIMLQSDFSMEKKVETPKGEF